MKSLLSRFGALILSVLSGFDRLRFRGCSRLLTNARGVHSYLYQHNLLIKEYAQHTAQLTKTLTRQTEALAAADGDRVHYLNSPNTDKEATALAIAQQRGLTTGRIAILSCVEGCRTYRVRKNDRGHIDLVGEPAPRRRGKAQHRAGPGLPGVTDKHPGGAPGDLDTVAL